ncbi:putative leucine-rich repeat-containing protein DDB_G0290503 [Clytia hemisphaerica]|uniref:Cnidarian restricted protein n=1 Tax=Clytia hemisphaerica TaxID=252671 RepID=A0A7M5XGI1_9CNID
MNTLHVFLAVCVFVVVTCHDVNDLQGAVNAKFDQLKEKIGEEQQDFNKKIQQGSNTTDATSWKIKLGKLSTKMNQALAEVWDIFDDEHQAISELKKNLSSFQSQLVVLNADIRNDFQKKINELENKFKQDSQQMKTQLELSFKSSLQNQANVFQNKISQQNQQINRLSSEVSKPSTWPAGSYCIFRSGSCPPGFVARGGYINAIRTYSADNRYIKAMTFGNSQIKCHGSCGQYGPYAELHIYTCCK